MTDRKIHILFRGKTKQSGGMQRRELFWLIHNIKENEGEKRKKYEGKLGNWINAHPFIKDQIMEQGVTEDNLVDKLINHIGRTKVFDTEKENKQIEKIFTESLKDRRDG